MITLRSKNEALKKWFVARGIFVHFNQEKSLFAIVFYWLASIKMYVYFKQGFFWRFYVTPNKSNSFILESELFSWKASAKTSLWYYIIVDSESFAWLASPKIENWTRLESHRIISSRLIKKYPRLGLPVHYLYSTSCKEGLLGLSLLRPIKSHFFSAAISL